MVSQADGKTGYNFVEIIIAVVILAVLAAMVVPQFGQATVDPDLAALSATLQTIRTQVQCYQLQHHGQLPPLQDFEQHMLSKTKADGVLSTHGSCGPYLLQIPANPLDGSRAISPTLDGTGGWMYNQDTGQFMSNDPGVINPHSPTKDL